MKFDILTEELKSLRKRANYKTQADLFNAMKHADESLTAIMIARIEAGGKEPGEDSIRKYCKFLGEDKYRNYLVPKATLDIKNYEGVWLSYYSHLHAFEKSEKVALVEAVKSLTILNNTILGDAKQRILDDEFTESTRGRVEDGLYLGTGYVHNWNSPYGSNQFMYIPRGRLETWLEGHIHWFDPDYDSVNTSMEIMIKVEGKNFPAERALAISEMKEYCRTRWPNYDIQECFLRENEYMTEKDKN